MITLPGIPIILDIDSNLRSSPAMWSLTLALNCTIGYYTKEHNIKILHTSYEKQPTIMPVNGEAMSLKATTVQESIIVTGTAIKDGARITISTKLGFRVYFFVVLQSNLLDSLSVVTDESLKYDLRLLKRLKNPSLNTKKLFYNKILKIGSDMDGIY